MNPTRATGIADTALVDIPNASAITVIDPTMIFKMAPEDF
jgi:hypothetical protein